MGLQVVVGDGSDSEGPIAMIGGDIDVANGSDEEEDIPVVRKEVSGRKKRKAGVDVDDEEALALRLLRGD